MDLEGPLVAIGMGYIGASLLVTMYNHSRLEADDPSRVGGAGGLIVGSFTTVGGVAALFYPHPAVRVTGAAMMAAGGYTVWCGVKSLRSVRRKFIEEEKQGLTLKPVLIDDGSGRLGPGIEMGWSF